MGKIELDHTGSGGGITLSSDGTDLLLDGTAVGGTTTTTAGESATTRYIPFVDNATGTSNETVRVDPALSFINNSAAFTGDQKLTVGQGNGSVPVTIMLNGNNNGGSYTPELLFYDGDTGASTDQKMGRITFQSADTGANGLARIEANVKGGQDPNDGSRIIFSTKDDGGTYAERLRITEGGALQIGTAYTLPTSDGTSGQVLTTDGSGAVTFADAGGNLELYAENPSTPTAPSATGNNAVAIGDGASATNNHSLAIGGTASASNSTAVAIGYGATASSGSSLALGRAASATTGGFNTALGYNAVAAGSGGTATALANSYASGADSFAAAITNNTSSYGATGANSVAMGYLSKATSDYAIAIGRENIAQSNVSSTAIGGKSNTASGHYSIIAGGNLNTATQSRSAVIGGQQNNATAQYSFVGGGVVNTASGQYSTALGGYGNMASGDYSFAHGRYAKADIEGKLARASGRFAATGDAQGGQFILRAATTDATATVLTTDNSTASTDNQIVAASDTCIMFSGTLVAMQDGAQDQGGWEIRGLLKNDGGTTTLVNSEVKTFADGNGWTVVLSADNTNNALAITCTGEAAHNIRWVANISTSEVTYA